MTCDLYVLHRQGEPSSELHKSPPAQRSDPFKGLKAATHLYTSSSRRYSIAREWLAFCRESSNKTMSARQGTKMILDRMSADDVQPGRKCLQREVWRQHERHVGAGVDHCRDDWVAFSSGFDEPRISDITLIAQVDKWTVKQDNHNALQHMHDLPQSISLLPLSGEFPLTTRSASIRFVVPLMGFKGSDRLLGNDFLPTISLMHAFDGAALRGKTYLKSETSRASRWNSLVDIFGAWPIDRLI